MWVWPQAPLGGTSPSTPLRLRNKWGGKNGPIWQKRGCPCFKGFSSPTETNMVLFSKNETGKFRRLRMSPGNGKNVGWGIVSPNASRQSTKQRQIGQDPPPFPNALVPDHHKKNQGSGGKRDGKGGEGRAVARGKRARVHWGEGDPPKGSWGASDLQCNFH